MKNTLSQFPNQLSTDKLIKFVVMLVLTIISGTCYVLAAFRSGFGIDSGYYMGCTNLIYEGYVPYHDFACGYTPLGLYLLLLPRWLSGVYPNYGLTISFLFLCSIIAAWLTGVIAKSLTGRRDYAIAAGLFFSIFYLYLEGTWFILEGMSTMWGMAAIAIAVCYKHKWWQTLLSGLLCANAFLTKQYGLIFIGIIVVFYFLNSKTWQERIINCALAFAGFFIAIVITLSFLLIQNATIEEIINNLFINNYGQRTIGTYINGVVDMIKFFPNLLLVPYLLWHGNRREMAVIIACITGIALSTLQFVFQNFIHYNIFIAPLAIIILLLTWQKVSQKAKSKWFTIGCAILFFVTIGQPAKRLAKIDINYLFNNQRTEYESWVKEGRQIKDKYNINNAFIDWELISLYGFTPFHPTCIQTYSFAFGSDDEHTLMQRLSDADCYISLPGKEDIVKKSIGVYQFFLKNFTLVNDSLNINVYLRNEMIYKE